METPQISPVLMERVDAGVAWLDENLPDWREIVNPATVDMTWEESCILGQYNFHKYGDCVFNRAVHAYFGGDMTRAAELGFLADGFQYAKLNAAWQRKFEEMNHNVKEAQG